ncbi:unnamed protein product, partial [Tenebrio molitor]
TVTCNFFNGPDRRERNQDGGLSARAVGNTSLDSVPYRSSCYTPPLDSTSCPQVGSNWARSAYVWTSRGRAAPRRPRRTPRIWRGGERGWFGVVSSSGRSSGCAFRGRPRRRRGVTGNGP